MFEELMAKDLTWMLDSFTLLPLNEFCFCAPGGVASWSVWQRRNGISAHPQRFHYPIASDEA
ncbi:hypothetical protein C5944_21205 [Cronobacter sakazakii]|nr:hypothetical protein [Cronobacter sakazakii]PPY30334.1 hypothetical protein C3D75_20805 [Cronobacter sakazakii]PQY69252.1 hypothetical protein C5944_21205 [Cronobacter sakazakii]PQY82003.1 hypothetical protein C5951_20090 [Cronobacter sakazakii]